MTYKPTLMLMLMTKTIRTLRNWLLTKIKMALNSQRKSIHLHPKLMLTLRLWAKKYMLQHNRVREREEKFCCVLTLTSSIMPKTCAIIAIIESAKVRWHMPAVTLIDLITQEACARTATSPSTISRERMPSLRSLLRKDWRQLSRLI